ncbi:MAG: penicillin-binding protein 2, partial [Bacteroidia bacterium]|nr:penicillin-binding protein 2 [Bacteroidia bacterium]
MNRRADQKFVIMGVFLLVAVIFILRLFYVQVIDDSYKLFSDENVLRKITEYPARGLMYDRNGKLVVYNEASYDLRVVPGSVELK